MQVQPQLMKGVYLKRAILLSSGRVESAWIMRSRVNSAALHLSIEIAPEKLSYPKLKILALATIGHRQLPLAVESYC